MDNAQLASSSADSDGFKVPSVMPSPLHYKTRSKTVLTEMTASGKCVKAGIVHVIYQDDPDGRELKTHLKIVYEDMRLKAKFFNNSKSFHYGTMLLDNCSIFQSPEDPKMIEVSKRKNLGAADMRKGVIIKTRSEADALKWMIALKTLKV